MVILVCDAFDVQSSMAKLLDSGSFTTSYKFFFFIALLDEINEDRQIIIQRCQALTLRHSDI